MYFYVFLHSIPKVTPNFELKMMKKLSKMVKNDKKMIKKIISSYLLGPKLRIFEGENPV